MVDILEQALEILLQVMQPTGNVFLHAIDGSGSISYYNVSSIGLSYCEMATTMAC
ncbi:hypothetical protein H6G02_31235 [Leptolyngbya sp. FACHB-16]|nr:hypothetical protein [Leptolyngbya sp. FACHB-16]MBD2158913.1 hypothetical protein [Leptolyngbya sp. FACHB-16]